jgi:hypothetical protein
MRIRLTGALVFLLVAAVLDPLEAQQRRSGGMPAGARQTEAALFVGVSRLDIDELNARLVRFGYPAFDNDFVQFGLVWATALQRVRLGFEVAGGARPAEVSGDGRYRTELSAGQAMFNVGLLAGRWGGLALDPKVGIGAGGLNLAILDRQPVTFDQVLARPGRGVRLSGGGLILDVSLGATYRLRADRSGRGGRSLMLGVRAGYTASVLHGGWNELRGDAPGGPEAGWGGPHLAFMIGRAGR